VTVKWRTLLAQHAVAMDPFLTEQIEHAIQKQVRAPSHGERRGT